MTHPKPAICEQDVIDTLTCTATRFFDDVFGMDYSRVLTTDESDLSDFSFSGDMPTGPEVSTLREEYARWDAWVIARINSLYGITFTSTRIKLVLLLSQVESSRTQTIQ